MKRKLILMLSLMITIGAGAQSKKGSTLTFDATKGEPMTLIAANGSQVKYTAYRGL